ncbi:MAG: phage tail tape measure protein [Flavobacteriales bacterium]|nr:phage tail tape measure protein [Flavobacteriales bacterium]
MASKTLATLALAITANKSEFESALQSMDRNMVNLEKRANKLGKQLTVGVTAPLTLLGATAFNVFKDFEEEMAKVQAVSGATGAEFQALQENAMSLGSSTRFTASEVAQLQVEFAKLGFSAKDITNVTEATLQLAQATGSDLARAAEVAGSTLSAFGLDSTETARVTDVMASSFSSTALDMESFAEAMKIVAPVANAAGVPIEEVTAQLGTLANAGIKGSAAGTSLRRIINELGSEAGGVSGSIEEMAAQGITLADAQAKVGRNAQSALVVLANGVEPTKELTKQFEAASGSAAEMAAIMDDTAQGSIKRTESAIEGMQLKLGKALAPAIIATVEQVGALATSFSELSPQTQNTVLVLGGVAAAAGPALVAFSKITKAVRTLNLTMKANPAGLFVAALAAVTLAVTTYTSSLDSAAKAQHTLNQATKQAQVEAAKEGAEVQRLSEVAQDLNLSLDKRKAALDKLQAIAPQYFGNLDIETAKVNELRNATDLYQESILKAAQAKVFQNSLEEQIGIMEGIRSQFEEWGHNIEDVQSRLNDPEAFTGGISNQMVRMVSDFEAAEKAAAGFTQKITDIETSGDSVQSTADKVASLKDELKGTLLAQRKLSEGSDQYQELASHADSVRVQLDNLTKKEEEVQTNLGNQKDKVDQLRDSWEGLNGSMTSAYEILTTSPSVNPNLYDPQFATIEDEEFNDPEEEAQINADLAQHLEDKQAQIDAEQAFQEELMKTAAIAEQYGTAVGSSIAQIVTGQKTAAEAMRGIAKQIISQVIQIAKANVIANATSPTNGANLASGGLATPGLIVAGLSMLEGFVTAFAEGGMVTGPTLALLGDNPSGKEMIIPFEKMGKFASMMGGAQRVEVYGESFTDGSVIRTVFKNQQDIDQIST